MANWLSKYILEVQMMTLTLTRTLTPRQHMPAIRKLVSIMRLNTNTHHGKAAKRITFTQYSILTSCLAMKGVTETEVQQLQQLN